MVKEYENNDTALAEALGKPYAFIYRLSDVYRGKTPQDFVPDKELMEAHFFDGKEEIRFINADGVLRAVKLYEEADEKYLERKYDIDGDRRKLVVRQILGTDDDRQYYVRTLRMSGMEGGV